MKRESLYWKTVDILLDAYNEGTLEKCNCYACAVGNIVAANMQKKFVKSIPDWMRREVYWEGYKPYNTLSGNEVITVCWYSQLKNNDCPEGIVELESTGYTSEELLRIEDAFESSSNILNGLTNVINTLGEIHEGTEEVTVQNVEKFKTIQEEKYAIV